MWLIPKLGICQSHLPDLHYRYQTASATTEEDQLIVKTGEVTRVWKWTGRGLVTKQLSNGDNGNVWEGTTTGMDADWAYVGLLEGKKAELVQLTAKKSTDEGFTKTHIEVMAEMYYPEVETFIKYEIWSYPGAPGIRTQVFFKGKGEKHYTGKSSMSSNEISIDLKHGKNTKPYAAQSKAELWFVNHATAKDFVEYHVKGFDSNRDYRIGVSWWDWDKQGRRQSIKVSSVDGEKQVEIFSDRAVSDHPELLFFELPKEVLIDGTFRLNVSETTGAAPVVSEIIVLEEGSTEATPKALGAARKVQLDSASTDRYGVIGYIDCGASESTDGFIATGRVDRIPLRTGDLSKTFIGYYNDTQHRNKQGTPLIKELSEDQETNNWASMVLVNEASEGVIMVKESHKCVNQYGVDTGELIFRDNGLENTGTGVYPKDMMEDQYQPAWASWVILYSGDNTDAQTAVKEFDKIRYPLDPDRDIYMQANTWGSGNGKDGARQENVLKEIATQAALGIDVQQIDDGWQQKGSWEPRDDWYPEGWEIVRKKAKQEGVDLGLWAAAMPIDIEELKMNYNKGGFVSYKLDFANLSNRTNINNLIGKIREFVLYTDHQVRVNWDVTENAPRFGYYWAREYGSVYLANRKPDQPENVVYIPYLVLRDIWHLAKYTNIHKFQTSIQNVDRVNRGVSDAYLHDQAYAVGIGLVGTPLFFQETHFYSSEDIATIKPVLKAYKDIRREWYESYVFPIGEEPDNKSWTGFQGFLPGEDHGYLFIYRERLNEKPSFSLQLKYIKNTTVRLVDLLTGQSRTVDVDSQGKLEVMIERAGSFKMIRIEYDNKSKW
ncbi:hypothetical protein DN752_22490 [Echinicola strongylocentroti]|uniref:Alpha-galactosidase n=2 Tax=Echinicola strongylocentroti TaxID=1795355 RepID=A0A2Z4IPP6_9BACT|nr:hypothetical protein DN752_22490 [Echinicola strongylocentroti]